VDPAGKAEAAMDPAKAMKAVGGGAGPARQGLRRTWQGVLMAPVTGEARRVRRCWASAWAVRRWPA
jgi:hypothetical protein